MRRRISFLFLSYLVSFRRTLSPLLYVKNMALSFQLISLKRKLRESVLGLYLGVLSYRSYLFLKYCILVSGRKQVLTFGTGSAAAKFKYQKSHAQT